jgi:tetratricopeptide (TPR) repeat protein
VAVAAAPAAAEPDETALLASAFRQLREGGDAAGALAALDERERRFGAGVLASEATLARAEALLRLGRTADALPLLLALSDTRAGLTPEVRATRAELLARSNRCDEAAADFDMLIAAPGSTAARERALYGRAACRLQGGRPDAALPDLQRYLADYPDGRFAPAVRSALQSLRRP